MSDESTQEYKLVTDKREEMKPLFDRMDVDAGLYLLEKFTMKKLAPQDSINEGDVANVTTNDPLLYAKKAIAITGSYQRQVIVEGEQLTDKQTTKIEQYLEDVGYSVNKRLPERNIPSLDAFINEQGCMRGRIPARCLLRLDKEGRLIADILPVDAKSFVSELNPDAEMWAAFTFSRSKGQIEKEYPGTSGLKKEGNEVVDFWYPDRNIVFVEKKIVKEQVHSYGEVPAVLSICPIGTLLNTESGIEHEGESIFWPNRDLWKEKNEVLTILKTLSRKALKGGLELQRSLNSPDKGKKPEGSPYQEDIIIETEIGGGFRQLPVNDIRAAMRLYYSVLETCLQRGELTPLDYGTLTFPLSSVAIMNLMAARNDIFAPILSMIALFYQALSRMIIRQSQSFGTGFKAGTAQGNNAYSSSDFDGDYSIQYQFSLLTKEGTAADAALANSLWGRLPDDYILREIMKVPNPDGMMFDLKAQQARNTDEVLSLFNMGLSFMRQAEELTGIEREIKQLEAKTMMQRIKTILRQRQQMGQLSPIEGKREEPKVENLLPLLEKGGGGARRPPIEETE